MQIKVTGVFFEGGRSFLSLCGVWSSRARNQSHSCYLSRSCGKCQIPNSLCQAGDLICIPALQGHSWSCCITVGTSEKPLLEFLLTVCSTHSASFPVGIHLLRAIGNFNALFGKLMIFPKWLLQTTSFPPQPLLLPPFTALHYPSGYMRPLLCPLQTPTSSIPLFHQPDFPSSALPLPALVLVPEVPCPPLRAIKGVRTHLRTPQAEKGKKIFGDRTGCFAHLFGFLSHLSRYLSSN